MTEQQIADLQTVSNDRGHPLERFDAISFLRAREITGGSACHGIYETIPLAERVAKGIGQYLVSGMKFNRIEAMLMNADAHSDEHQAEEQQRREAYLTTLAEPFEIT